MGVCDTCPSTMIKSCLEGLEALEILEQFLGLCEGQLSRL